MMILLALFGDVICFADLKTSVLTHMTFAAYHSFFSFFSLMYTFLPRFSILFTNLCIVLR